MEVESVHLKIPVLLAVIVQCILHKMAVFGGDLADGLFSVSPNCKTRRLKLHKGSDSCL